MTNKEIEEFNGLMQGLAEIYGENVSDERLLLFWEALKDLPLGTIKSNINNHIRLNKFFPKPSELRGEQNIEIQAQKDIAYLENLLNNYYFPGFGESSMNIISQKLKEDGKEYLAEMIDRFGVEMVNQFNPSATRAQMLNAYKADVKAGRLMLNEKQETKEICGKTEKLIDKIVD